MSAISIQSRRRGVPQKSVGELLPTLMRPAFEKFGFSAAAILTDWPAIAGAEIASYTAPERLKWPRNKPEDGAGERKQTGATLVLRVGGARALEVEYMRGQLIERINACFGYRAVSEIRIVQAPVENASAASSRNRKAPASPPPSDISGFDDIQDERLKSALTRMACSVPA
ncbi:MAG: DciA family protein [Alphaproteobacteria bacterium]